MECVKLVEEAKKARKMAYAPYSNFKVGAALLTGNGKVYTGANVENASFGATCCAERTAVFQAVSDGEREVKAIAVISDSDDYIYPCGICRQVLAEFGRDDTVIICCRADGNMAVHTLKELMPHPFK